jgi:hypothetical protein
MKLFSVLLFAALTAAAQPPPADNPSDVSQPPTSVELRRPGGVVARSTPAERTSGVLVKAARSNNPAQLINPRAPRDNGDGWDNVSFDLITGQAQGLKLFAIGF